MVSVAAGAVPLRPLIASPIQRRLFTSKPTAETMTTADHIHSDGIGVIIPNTPTALSDTKSKRNPLTEDIKRRGVLHPPKVRAGEVIDGWHRVLAAVDAGRSIDVVELDAATTHEELASLTAAENCLRRNMPKLDAALALTRLRGMANDGTCPTTVEADASMLGTSERTIQYARAQLRREMGLSTPGSAPPAEESRRDYDPAPAGPPEGAMLHPPDPGLKPQPQGVSSENVDAGIGLVVRRSVRDAELVAAMARSTVLARPAATLLRAAAKLAADLSAEYRRRLTDVVACILCGQDLAPDLVDGLRSCCAGCLRSVPRETLTKALKAGSGVIRRDNPAAAENPAR